MTPFFEAARQGRNHFLVWVATILIVIGASQVIGSLPLLLLMLSKGISPAGGTIPFASLGLGSTAAMALMLVPFVAGLAALVLCIRYLHRRPIGSVVGAGKPRWILALKGAGIWLAYMLVSLLVRLNTMPDNFSWNFSPEAFVPLVLVAVLLIPLQAGFEEALFRGYLMQGLGMWMRRPWIAMLVVALLFGALHGFNPEVKAHGMWLMLPQYIGLGFLLGWVTLKTGGLEMAVGIHSMNNIFSALVVTNPDFALQTPALYVMHQMTPVYDLAELGVVLLLFMFFMRKG